MADPMHIAFVASEMAPFAKTGGLADVIGALPKALAALGHRVTVFLPRYGPIEFPPGPLLDATEVPLDGNRRIAWYFERVLADRVRVIFVDYAPFFDRPGASPYGDGGG